MNDSDATASGADEVVVERLPPDEAFELLAHETRFRILETLNDADEALSFSDLRERVGLRDAGQFNYHLGKLTDRFVRSTDEGYELAAPGWRVVGAILSGGYTKILDADPVETSIPCPSCENEMELRFRDEKVNIHCPECEETYTNTPIPAGIFEGVVPEEATTVIDRWLKRLHASADYGFCPNCDGRLDRTVLLADDEDAPDGLEADEVLANYACTRCGYGWYSSLPFAVVLHPAIVGFYHDHSIDVRATPFWELDGLEADAATVESRDPLQADVRIAIDRETAVFTFDEELNVVEERRE